MIHRPTKNLNFTRALDYLKDGKLLAREGWNGENMFLWLKPGTDIKAEFCQDPILKKIAEDNGGTIVGLPTICMKTADNKILTGWIASQSDIFAEDWFVVK